jgi:lysophospholipase L1-like esterase
MKLFFHFRVGVLVLAFFAFRPSAIADGGNFGSAEPFKTGDTVCFIGDSITRGGNYLSYINLFYATRFPDRKIQIWNCGVGGDTSGGIVSNEVFRLKKDILSHRPTVATIMLGMNDIGHRDYGPDQSGTEVEKRRQHSLDMYDQNMRKLIGTIQQSGARLILITPSIYDETTKLEKAKPNVGGGRSAALAICAEKVRQWSAEYHTGLVNFQEVMNTVTSRGQAKDPAFTIVGPDRVHPGAVGHFIMAYTFLKAQGMPREVAHIAVDAGKATAADAANCEITDVKATAAGVEFDCLERALPFVPTQETQPALVLVPFEQDFNQEPLFVMGLEPGRYELQIDGKAVGEYTAAELQNGVNLAQNEKTPQHRQSAAATKINYDRSQAAGHLRVVAEQYYTLSRRKVDLADRAAVEKGLSERFAEEKVAGKPLDLIAEQLLSDPGTPVKLEAKLQELSTALDKACQPRKHHFALKKKS